MLFLKKKMFLVSINGNTTGRSAEWICLPCGAAMLQWWLFCIPVMLLCKRQVNEGLTLHASMDGANSENACNQWKQGASALGFTLDQCSKMGNRNLDTREPSKCISLRAATQRPHFEIFPVFMLEATQSWNLLSVPDKPVTCVNGYLASHARQSR